MVKNNIDKLKNYKILYVEDNLEIAEEIAFFLNKKAGELYSAYNGEEGVALFNEKRPDIVITDIQMPKMNGIEMIREIRKIDSNVPIIITTAFNESKYLLEAIDLQVDGYLMKPLNMKELINRVLKILEPIELKQALMDKNSELEEINNNLDAIAKEKTKELEHFYAHDPLTGLENFIALGQEIDTGEYRHLLLLDVSNFSLINKQYGKDFSNAILKEIAKILKSHIANHARLFKTESDRFVFLLEEEDHTKIEEFCQQLISFFDTQAVVIDAFEVNISFSMGIAEIAEDFFPLVNAEFALDIGKKTGSRYYYFYDETEDSVKQAKETIKWINITKEMIQNDRIEPYFQPIADTQTGEIVKYEVLARGNYEGEVFSPYFFISPAERLGMISSITRMMIGKSFQYFNGQEMNFSINITHRDLLDKFLIQFLEQKLELYNIEAKNVTFEILENITIGEQHKVVIAQLKALKTMGFKIAIDDFGIENSNFSRLLEIDFDYIKLDGLFIKSLEVNTKDRIVVSAIVSLAKTLGIKTVAEYVENEAIYNIIKECGVDMAQGYYIGKPEAQTL
ncbi:EAL domain-containing protein [Sulfurimonas aquatica]|uniref:EAL domain-containing protein n=1 Tax=Sulfurimonas aquatica TaxID=2672570 RepID=A0A975AYT8_9BACT|nr:EAL domain-containing protein [Sulfurimonas aquatica]QSZ40998.1 EAL domain-containing protein [Sulfurimonas aquatica]